MAELTAFQVAATARSSLAATLTDDDVEAFTDCLSHDACVTLSSDALGVTFTVWAADAGSAGRQARVLVSTATVFGLPRAIARWYIDVREYEEAA